MITIHYISFETDSIISCFVKELIYKIIFLYENFIKYLKTNLYLCKTLNNSEKHKKYIILNTVASSAKHVNVRFCWMINIPIVSGHITFYGIQKISAVEAEIDTLEI